MSKSDTILLAEDDENDAFLLRTALSKAGVANPVAHVHNGEDAFHYLTGDGAFSDRAKYPFPCLLITDLKMPRFSGFDLLARAKTILESKHLTAIVLTASVADSDKQRSLELGAQAYYVKPSNFGALIALAHDFKQSWLAPVTARP
jgi:CheY-like chemotaxis protein